MPTALQYLEKARRLFVRLEGRSTSKAFLGITLGKDVEFAGQTMGPPDTADRDTLIQQTPSR